MTKPETLVEPLKGSDVIINLSAQHKDNVHPISLYYEVNMDGAKNVCDVAGQLGIKHIVFTSSVAVYVFVEKETGEDGEYHPFNDYGKSKLQAEHMYDTWQAKSSDNILVTIRPTYVVGNGDEYSTLKSYYEIHNIKFTRKIENPFPIINKCDFIISSLVEGFPLAIFEGLSCGLSYILSNIPPHIEIHELANHNGFLIENVPSSFDSIFALVEKYNLYEFEKNCRALYLEKFTTEKMVESHTNLYISSLQ
ncbi:NAD-dependent epimerase/dehydratase family protein [Escherichia coli]|uniref:NAD-dependent epimerase/dehydratase family protein n=1 Tax=Escherichia coli TaxID=562 RepID=UPI001595307D|nr:NAD(P)-dependent oxidoreductase [Escherichia coli]HBH9359472.1 NAD-dependent epimerase/dehydratase family protein [Escherichia coli]HDC4236520.1 NAD-dependent epimerase/dehydratase family protein [Escherichia coli]